MTIAEGGQSADVGHAVAAEVSENLFLRHVSELWGVDGTLAGVTTVVERDLDLFFAENGSAEESFCVFSGGCFENQCAIGRSSAIGDDSALSALTRTQWTAAFSQIRAWVGTGSRARGRARVGVPSEVIGRAAVIAPGEVRTRARVSTG